MLVLENTPTNNLQIVHFWKLIGRPDRQEGISATIFITTSGKQTYYFFLSFFLNSRNRCKAKFFGLLMEGFEYLRIRILEAQINTDPDPKHCGGMSEKS